jgi:tetratricopeptide (TPR) repeat protein
MGVIGATTGTHLADAARALEYYLAHPVRADDLKDRARASNKLGLVYEKQGRRDDARRAYQQATTWAPSSRTYKESVARVTP